MIAINITEKACIINKPISISIDLYMSYTFRNTRLISLFFNDLLSVHCSVCEAAITLDSDGGMEKAKSFKKPVVTRFDTLRRRNLILKLLLRRK
jgi:hypothetical protein